MSTLTGGLQADDGPEELSMEPSITRRRAPRIMRVDVFRAADELLVQGDRPSIDRVRMRIGRGSPNTINDHLDAWWKNLGSRLRDLPGREFPQLPERVAQSLQNLWNEALAGAHEVLQTGLLEREQLLSKQEVALQLTVQEFAERDRAANARMRALEESVTLARDQLTAANQRAEALECALQERDRECGRLRGQVERLEAGVAEIREKSDMISAAHHAERVQLQERHAEAERHWLQEVDRSRELAKEATKARERQGKETRAQITALRGERDQLREQLMDARSELKATVAVREQLEERVRLIFDSQIQKVPARGTRKVTRSQKSTSR